MRITLSERLLSEQIKQLSKILTPPQLSMRSPTQWSGISGSLPSTFSFTE